MHVIAGIAGFLLIAIILVDAFETIVLPRRVTRRFRYTRAFYRITWRPWRKLAGWLSARRRRETLLGFYGPLSLIFLLLSWALLLILGFALLQWAWGTHLNGPTETGFREALYFSGTTFSTLGLGDIHPTSTASRILTVWESGAGFGFLAIVIGYLPTIYQAFSRRESTISLLDARAGSPPTAMELFRRAAEVRALHHLDSLLREFERWAADVLESHISYPSLAFFRSQHNNESWVASLTMILDTCALLIVGVNRLSGFQAQLTFAMARHALVDLCQVLGATPAPPVPDRLPASGLQDLQRLMENYRAPLRQGEAAVAKLAELRRMYEPYANALAKFLVLELPPWIPRPGLNDNWQTSAWERAARRIPADESVALDDHV